jgi:hypothetical protein
MATTNQPEQSRVRAFRNVFTFAAMAHVADIITTHWRAPNLADEGNAVYTFVKQYGLGGWPYLISIKVIVVGLLAFGYWWYLAAREGYLPHRRVTSIRGLIWYSMWDGREYPQSVWRRILNVREIGFGVLVMAAIALPASAAAALYYSIDNALTALGHPLPWCALRVFVGIMTPMMFAWWCLAYRQYYHEQLRLGLVPDTVPVEE